jgi:hypothetical protein
MIKSRRMRLTACREQKRDAYGILFGSGGGKTRKKETARKF